MVLDEPPAKAGEDRRTARETRPVLLAPAGRGPSDAATVFQHAAAHRSTTAACGVVETAWQEDTIHQQGGKGRRGIPEIASITGVAGAEVAGEVVSDGARTKPFKIEGQRRILWPSEMPKRKCRGRLLRAIHCAAVRPACARRSGRSCCRFAAKHSSADHNTVTFVTCGLSKSYSQAAEVPSSNATSRFPA